MTHNTNSSFRSTLRSFLPALLCCCALAGALAAQSGVFVPDPHQNGAAAELKIAQLFWARLAEVHDLDPATGVRTLQYSDFAIGTDIASDGVDFELVQSRVDERWHLTILHPAGSAAYASAFARIDQNVTRILDKGLEPIPLPPFTMVPRNAALVIRFDDLVDEATIAADTVSLLADALGVPGTLNLAPHEARLIPDRNHGGIAPGGAFHTTRVVVDLSVGALESLTSPVPLAINPAGLPAARLLTQPSAALSIPTVPDPSTGHPIVLANLGGNPVALAGNGSTLGKDVVRSFRAGAGALGDPYAGMLRDDQLPEVLGVTAIQLQKVRALGGGHFFVGWSQALDCARVPLAGDGIAVGGGGLALHLLEVVAGPRPIVSQGGALIEHVLVQLVFGDPATLVPGRNGELMATFRSLGGDDPVCFIGFSPPAMSATNVDPSAVIELRFSEPLDAATVEAFATFEILREGALPLFENVCGAIVPSVDLREYRFVPALPLTHAAGAGEGYRVALAGGATGVLDLAGNPLRATLPETRFTLDPAAPAEDTSGIALVFDSTDEDGNGAPELRGQFLFDLQRAVIRSRPVVRFSAQVDKTQPIIQNMVPFTGALKTPLSQYGSKLMHVWRHADLGIPLTDEALMNIDVEGLHWAAGSPVMPDAFSEFQMALAHAKFLPEDFIDVTLLPAYPNSGVVETYDENLLDPAADPLKVVHPKAAGYVIDPLKATQVNGNTLVPWPMNQGIPKPSFQHYTWRDTALTAVGAPNGAGADLMRLRQIGQPAQTGLYPAGEVPTIGLPLLLEFRCWPDASAFGMNDLKINLAFNSSSRPCFRAFSTGASNALVDPDAQPVATGQAGQPSPPIDDVVHEGQVDFVVRISRSHTVWLDTSFASALFAPPVLELGRMGLPPGTGVTLAFRGATGVTPGSGNPPAAGDATRYDFYGNLPASTGAQVTFLNADPSWKADPAQVDGARFVQARISMTGDFVSGATPELSAMGLPFRQ